MTPIFQRSEPARSAVHAVAVYPTFTAPTALSHPTSRPPVLLCDVAEMVSGAETLPSGAETDGPVHAFTAVITKINEAKVMRVLRRVGLFI
jgi:hypothetical protein